jgi:hypothetical protein
VPSRARRSVAGLHRCAGIVEDRKGWLFRTARGHNGSILSDKPMSQPDAWRMIRRRAAAAGIAEAIGCHTFRATGITAYLANGGALEHFWLVCGAAFPKFTVVWSKAMATGPDFWCVAQTQHRMHIGDPFRYF